jgi:hypothetical protein
MLTKEVIIGQVEVVANNCVQVRQDTIIKDGDVEISRTYHRHVLAPGDNLDNQDPKVRAIAEAVWTPEIIAAYQASLGVH